MSNSSLPTFTLSDIRRHFPQFEGNTLGDDFMICQINGKEMEESRAAVDAVSEPIRFDGFL